MPKPITLLFLADTHLGFDTPLRPQIARRRRGNDFNANYLTALQPALEGKADLVIHGGDLFFRSRVHSAIVAAAFAPLLRIAEMGIPVLIVPGNHERSNIPQSLLEKHPGISIFDRPRTFHLTLQGCRLAMAGFPNIRHNPRQLFASNLAASGWDHGQADLRLLCLHQAFEGAQVGVQNYTFRGGDEVIRGCDIPAGLDGVLSGHIHRHQLLTHDLAGRRLAAPVYYPGATERTSFAERVEEKGYLLLHLAAGAEGGITVRFVPLPTRPMVEMEFLAAGLTLEQADTRLRWQIAGVAAEAIVHLRAGDEAAVAMARVLNDRWLRSVAPATMNINWSLPWPHPGGPQRAIAEK